MNRQTATQRIAEMLKEIYDERDVNAAEIFKGRAHDTLATYGYGWHLRWFGENEHIFLGKDLVDVGVFCDDVRSQREHDQNFSDAANPLSS